MVVILKAVALRRFLNKMKCSHAVRKFFLVGLILRGQDPHLRPPVGPRKPVLLRGWGAFLFPLPFFFLYLQVSWPPHLASRRCLLRLHCPPSPPLPEPFLLPPHWLLSPSAASSLSLSGLTSPPLLSPFSSRPLPFPSTLPPPPRRPPPLPVPSSVPSARPASPPLP